MKTEFEQEYIKFGLKVQYYRKLKGITQEDFAEKIGRSWSFIAKVEGPTNPCGCVHGNAFQDRPGAGRSVSKLILKTDTRKKAKQLTAASLF